MIIEFPSAQKRREDPADAYDIYPWPWRVLDGLPFVGPAPPPRANGRPSRLNRNCWIDKSTESGINDYARGKRYAKMMLAAMQANNRIFEATKEFKSLGPTTSAKALEDVLESMIRDAVALQKKGGKGSRTFATSAMRGFLSELSREIACGQ